MRSTKLLLVMGAGALLIAGRCTERPTTPPAADTAAAATTEAPAAAYSVYRDANTGALREPQPNELADAHGSQFTEATSSSADGLQAMHSPVPGGGVVMRLNGRFHSSMMAKRQLDGTSSVECVDPLPPASQPKEGSQ